MAAQAQVARDPLSRVCAYCRTGIHSSALFAECTYCRLPYCTSCRFEHQASHQQAVVLLRSVIHQFEDNGGTEVCARCSRRVSFSYACCECEYALCRSCWFEEEMNVHQHKVFNVIEPLRLVKSNSGVADVCCTVAAVNHCSTCSAPFSLGQETIFCKTCYLQTNERVYLCVRCYISSEKSHPRYHEFWHWTVEAMQPGGLARGIHCNECSHAIRSVEDLKAHPHTSYVQVYTEKHLNQVIARSYRQCQRKAGRVDDMMAEGSDQCIMCLQKTVISSFLPCRQCREINRLCAHCAQHASKLHIHELPAGDSSGSPRLSSATVIQNIPMDTPSRSSTSSQPPQFSTHVRTRSSPMPSSIRSPVPNPVSNPVTSAIPSPLSSASHHSPPLSPYRATQPPSKHFYIECEPQSIYVPSQYPLQQGQDGLHFRSFSDPTITFSRSHTPPGWPQDYLKGPPESRPAQRSQKLQPEKSSQPAPPSTPTPRNSTGFPYRAPTLTRKPVSATPSISLQPDLYGPTPSRPAQPPQPRQSSHSTSPSQPLSYQPNLIHPSHSKPAQPIYPEQSLQPAYPTPSASYQPNLIRPSHSTPAQPIYPEQSPQPTYPTTPTSYQPNPIRPSHGEPVQPVYPEQSPQPTYPTPPTSYQPSPTHAFPSRPAQPPDPTQHPQSAAPTTPDTPTTLPITLVSSAPQVLVSTPEHPQEAIPHQKRTRIAAGFKSAYAATQKNAATRIATRVVAKTAFSAVSNVIGADISGVIDVAGGLNLGGTGIDAGNLVGNAVTSIANSAFDEATGEGDRGSHGGSRWKNLKGRQGARLGGGGGSVNQEQTRQT